MKFNTFKKIINQKSEAGMDKNILIFMHDYPDPDSLTSALILKTICEHFKLNTRIVHGGEIIRAENKAMVQLLKFKVFAYKPGEEDKFYYTAMVDTNQFIKNHQFPETITPDFTFDHHSFKSKQSLDKWFEKFYEINTGYGSCASILMDYLIHFKIPLTEQITTAYCYTMLAETNHFERDFSKEDVRLYRKAIQTADLKVISHILNIKKPLMYFDTLKNGLNNYKTIGYTSVCHLGMVKSIEMIHQIADFLLKQKDVKVSIVTGYSKGNSLKKVCVRSQHPSVHVGTLLKKVLADTGQGGGHKKMAAGNFKGDEVKVVKKFLFDLPKK